MAPCIYFSLGFSGFLLKLFLLFQLCFNSVLADPGDTKSSCSNLAGYHSEFVMLQHQLRGIFTVLENCSFRVSEFDMLQGSDVHWWGAVGDNFVNLTNGFVISDENLNRTYKNDSFVVSLKGNVSWDQIKVVSVWDLSMASDFGHVVLQSPENGTDNSAPAPSPAGSDVSSSNHSDSGSGRSGKKWVHEQPTMFDNCKALSSKYRVRWTLKEEENLIDIGLEAVTGIQNYMAFGWANPHSASGYMLLADVAITGFTEAGMPLVEDYYITDYSECTVGENGIAHGVCPDSIYDASEPIPVNNTKLVYGHHKDGVSFIRYQRPLNSVDKKYDVPMNQTANMTVIWALGRVKPPDSIRPYYLPQYHGTTYGHLVLNVSNHVNDCLGPLDAEDKEDQDLIIADAKVPLVVTSGPGPHYPNPPNPSKVIYINKKEAPLLRVERGVPVTFSMQAGHDVALYITSDSLGGNATMRNMTETIYAGGEEFHGVPASPKELVWAPDRNTPDQVFYQSAFEQKMGWKVQVVDGGLSDMFNNSVVLDDQQVNFYWTLSEHTISIAARGEKKSGYLAVGFGSGMVNSFAYVGWIDDNGKGAKGCSLVGPQCVLSCAKERRALPKQQFTCCLAMDGVKVLASGFDAEERAELGKLVISMGGTLQSKASLDVNFVLVKAVSAAKYQWAAHFKKPIVTSNWLLQCWNEHRLVPHESYRVPPFFGLIICVTRIPAEERKDMEKLIVQNGGKYSAELTRTCTHLICDVPQGDKYKVARRWGHIPIVTRKWFGQSIARRVCLKEDEYQVLCSSANTRNIAKHSQGKSVGSSLSASVSVAADSHIPAVSSAGALDSDLEVISQRLSSIVSDSSVSAKQEADGAQFGEKNEVKLDGCVADDSQSDDDDLYLSDCRICLVGFDASSMRKLVNIVRKGGGSRFMSYSARLTHIVIGAPSDVEKKEIRGLAALGVIHVVKALWLEDCDRARKEVPVMQRHIAYDILLPKDMSGLTSKRSAVGTNSLNRQESIFSMPHCVSADMSRSEFTRAEVLTHDTRGSEENDNIDLRPSLKGKVGSLQIIPPASSGRHRNQPKIKQHVSSVASGDEKPFSVFMGRLFCFSDAFPVDRKDEVVEWIHQGGGSIVDNQIREKVDFTVECHGVTARTSGSAQTAYVSSHWVRCCLEDRCLLDVSSHMLFSPLPCQVPLPGFEVFRFSVSQYEDKDRLLLRNLSFVLGAKFGEKLTKKVTHLLCKFASGPKYEAACRWGIPSVTCEWIYECVRKNKVVALDPYHPKEASTRDREAGFCTVSQYPTQANRMICGDDSSQIMSGSLDSTKSKSENYGTKDRGVGDELRDLSCANKRARLFGNDCTKNVPSSYHNVTSLKTSTEKCTAIKEDTLAVPDVATAIEDLLEETSKIHDSKSPGETECTRTIFSSDCRLPGANNSDSHTNFGLSKNWLSRIVKKDEPCQPPGDQRPSIYDGFSETQTESQLVGYEEDLSGRQMIIDRVRTRSSAS